MHVLRWAVGLLLVLGVVAEVDTLRATSTSYSVVFRMKSRQAGPWFRIYRDGKWGYADRQGRMRVPARYDDVTDFFEGLAAVQVNDRWGYIDEQGTFVAEPQFESAGPFTGGLAVVRVDGQAGAIDRSGAFVIPAIYSDLFPSPGGGVVGAHESGQYVIVGTDGHEIAGRGFRDAQPFTEGLAAACIDPIDGPSFGFRAVLADYSCGYVDRTARFVVPPVYGSVMPFNGGIAGVWSAEHRAFGLIRRDGALVRGFEFEEIKPFSEGLAFARDRTGGGYLGTDGRFAFRVDTAEGGDFSNGLASVRLRGRDGFVDREGRLVVPAQYDLVRDFSEGLAPVNVGDHWGYVDRAGRLVISARFDDAGNFVDGLALARTGDTWDYINPQGRTIMQDVCDPEDVTPRTIC